MSQSLVIENPTRASLPRVDFRAIKDTALGKEYQLSLAFVTSREMAELNLKYRDKNSPTDILSFPLDEQSGEIYISLEEAMKEAPKFDREFENFVAFLFIHGCVHLKGYDHGGTMESIETELRSRFNI